MKIAVVYCYPLVKSATYYPLAKRFAQTYAQFLPGATPHELHVVCNGARPGDADLAPFKGITHRVHARSNMGWDIGAYQWAAESIRCDLMVCLGAPVHFYRAGWIDRIAQVFLTHSPALFGCWGIPFRASDHIRTTTFWMQPELLQAYPNIVGSLRASRYEFEHGRNSFTKFAASAGYEPLMVTFDSVYPQEKWGEADGSIGKCLMFDQFVHR